MTALPGAPEAIQVDADGHAVLADLYRAPDPEAPVLLSLHGGAWIMGSRADHPERLAGLASRGVTVVSIDYRLAGRAAYPAQRDDVVAVFEEILGRGIVGGTGRAVLMGASAGAQLAALIATECPRWLAGTVAMFGRYDLTRAGDLLKPEEGLDIPEAILEDRPLDGFVDPGPRGRLALLAGVPEAHLDDRVLAALSPAHRITADAAPLLLLHGAEDAVVSPRHSELLAARAEQLGVDCRLELIPGANHEDPAFGSSAVLDRIASFVMRAVSSPASEMKAHERTTP